MTAATLLVEYTNADTLHFRITFSEPVRNVDLTDFTASGVTANISVGAGADRYQVTVSGGNLPGHDGAVSLSLKASGHGITDMAGNASDPDRAARRNEGELHGGQHRAGAGGRNGRRVRADAELPTKQLDGASVPANHVPTQ